MEVLTLVSKGNNPQLDKIKKREELTFKEYFIERFLPLQLDRRFSKEEFSINDEGRIKWRKGVQKKIYNLTDGYNAHFRFAKFINKKISDITEEDVILFSKQITKSHIHNRLMKELSRFFNTTSLNVNPVRRALATDIQLRPTKARTVKAKPEEVIAIGKSLELIKNGYMQDNGYYYQPQPQQVNIIKILLFEGLRPNEVYKMEWSMVNELGVYDTDTKTGDKTIPLTKQSLNILSSIEKKSKFVFPSPTNNDQHIKSIRKIWTKVLELSGVNPELRIYDLRNTFSSKASMMFGTWVSSKLTNHTNSKTVEKHYSDLDSGERVSRKNEVAETFENLLQGGGRLSKSSKYIDKLFKEQWKREGITPEDIEKLSKKTKPVMADGSVGDAMFVFQDHWVVDFKKMKDSHVQVTERNMERFKIKSASELLARASENIPTVKENSYGLNT